MSLRLENYKKQLKTFELNASFEVQSSERVALIGKSGSGKSTLIRFLCGLDSQAQGRVWLQGEDLTSVAVEDRNFGVCFQTPSLFESISVLDNVTIGLKARGFKPRERAARGLDWLARIGLESRANDSVSHLSGGEAQRVSLARILILEPRALLLDEPFSSLDADLRGQARTWVKNLTSNLKIPLLLVTHDLDDVKELTTRSLQIIEEGATRTVKEL